MAEVFGYELVARALKNEGADTMFFIMGGPMLGAQDACRKLGIRMIDVRHEQAAVMMANAYARLTGKAGVCSSASGPAATNLVTGLAHAYTDSAPIIALGGASPISQFHSEAFQEIDQLNIMRPACKWAAQAITARRIPEYINMAYRQALTGRLGPAYLDLPGDVLYARVDEESVVWPQAAKTEHRIPGDPSTLARIACHGMGCCTAAGDHTPTASQTKIFDVRRLNREGAWAREREAGLLTAGSSFATALPGADDMGDSTLDPEVGISQVLEHHALGIEE